LAAQEERARAAQASGKSGELSQSNVKNASGSVAPKKSDAQINAEIQKTLDEVRALLDHSTSELNRLGEEVGPLQRDITDNNRRMDRLADKLAWQGAMDA
jgi:peptidoglycan hydrolase CwlO-like protein